MTMKYSHHILLHQIQRDVILQDHITLQPGLEIMLDTRRDVLLKEEGM